MLDYRTRLAFLEWLVMEQEAKQQRYAEYRAYYDGDHQSQMTKRTAQFLSAKSGIDFRANYCDLVVDAMASKLAVTGFAAGDVQSAQLWEWWQAARMDSTQGDVHTATVRDGDAYVITEWNNDAQRPMFTLELAYDGSEGVKMHYSGDRRGLPVCASKRWQIRDDDIKNAGYVRRMNVYFPDRIEKYVSDQRAFEGAWTPYRDGGEWPVWWTTTGTEAGEPLGIPVVHFKHKASGYNYGLSRLDDVVPLQNAVNKVLLDILGSADTDAFPILYTFGDDFGSLTLGPGAHIYSEKADASIGRLGGGDLSQLLAAYSMLVMEIARTSNTPLSRFQISGQVSAEGTLKQQEAALIEEAETLQIALGNAWEDVLLMGRKLHNAFGPGGMDETQLISTQWKPAAARDETTMMQRGLLLKEADVPHVIVWRRMGLTDEEIAEALESDEYLAAQAGRQAMMDLGAVSGS